MTAKYRKNWASPRIARTRPEEPGIKMLIPAMYRGDSHIVMLEIKAPPQQWNDARTRNIAGTAANPIDPSICTLANVFVKYKDLVHPANREARATSSVRYTPSKEEMIYSVNRSVKKNLLGFQTGEALTQAARSIEQGRIGDAIAQVEERRNVVSIAAQQWQDDDLSRDGKLSTATKPCLSNSTQISSSRRATSASTCAARLPIMGMR